jgi:hypothetical protein
MPNPPEVLLFGKPQYLDRIKTSATRPAKTPATDITGTAARGFTASFLSQKQKIPGGIPQPPDQAPQQQTT